MRATGLDGFSRGWVAVSIDGDQRTLSFHGDIADALARPFDRAGIDIPIGMTDDGQRDCDRLARARLRPHTSRALHRRTALAVAGVSRSRRGEP
ncbi:DUF429 domain-containing protein [Bradyrhizobium altum]|uniref:DUF429 domain-containing protein n=1 Tax=Bradyrhizobium altum TaxID=1571202 RepID=UPI0024C0E6AE|nr:DUF429 domain-containing protein [Bradyrhizobium altum]